MLPAVTREELQQAVVGELAGCWARALRWWSPWLQDAYVDLALLRT